MRKSPSCCRRLQSWTYKEQLSWPGRIYFPISSLWFNVGREWVIWPQSSLVLLRTFNLLVDENICWIMIKIVFQNKNMNWSHLLLNCQSMPGVDQNLTHYMRMVMQYNVPNIPLRYAQDMPKICPRYFLYQAGPTHIFPKGTGIIYHIYIIWQGFPVAALWCLKSSSWLH